MNQGSGRPVLFETGIGHEPVSGFCGSALIAK